MRHAFKRSIPLCALLLFAAAPALAEQAPMSITNPEANAKAARAYWTPERFKAAKPMPMPAAAAGAVSKTEAPSPEGKVEYGDGQPPSQEFKGTPQRLYTPDMPATENGLVATPGAVGTFGAHYTSTRVFPMFTGSSAPFSADRAYPYITVGKLFFTIGRDPYVCSAAVIQRRVVATAGHCVHNGNGSQSGFYSNWVFVPAFRDGTAPLLAWNWSYVIVTGTWASGGGGVPNAADYAMIEFADQPVTPGGPPVRISTVTGWLGWQTLSLAQNHTSKLGYPCNLDSCQKMQNVTSGSFRTVAPNNVEYGSDALGGSSGGPWVQNFQVMPTGGGTGSNTGSNRVVGITSYIYVPPDPKVQGASILDNRWIQILNTICGRLAGNCS